MTGERKIVQTDEAPRAIGPYSQAVVEGGWVFCSGQIALDPATGELVGRTAAEQAERAMRNLEAVLQSAGARLRDVVKTTIYLADMKDFEEVNRVYGQRFKETPPARSTVAAAGLPRGALVEIDAIARLTA